MDQSQPLSCKSLGVLIAVVAVIWFALLGYRDLVDPDEGRYAEIPREMVASGDWITPRLNGFKYFEKPVLHYWVTAISLSLFGDTNGAARLGVVLLAFLGALWILYLGRRLFGPDAGMYAFLVLCSSLMYVLLGHLNILDLDVSVYLSLGIGALLLAQTQRDRPPTVRNWMLVGWAALALATLSKGLIGLVLPGVALVLYTLWQRDWALWKHLHLGKGLVLFLLITVPWFVLVSRANPEFAQFFFIHEHLERYTTTTHERVEPWWFFVPLLFIGAMPWLWNSVSALVRPGFAPAATDQGGFDPVRFLWVYVVGILLFFSVGQSKLPPYILPVYPALALLIGRQLASRPALPGVFGGYVLTLLAVGYGAFAVTGFHDYESPTALLAYRTWILVAMGVLVAGLGLGVVYRLRPRRAIIALAVSGLLALQLLGWGFQTQSRHRSSHELAEVIKSQVGDDVPVYNVDTFYHSLPFYLGRDVILVGFKGELAMGIEQEPRNWVSNWPEFARRWQEAEQAVAVFDMKIYPDVYQARMAQLPMRVIYQDPLKIAVVRQ
ncbi:MAG: glycosyltransferase family 39 protein [Proteobacteria bacterium]|jgi:4-amino-4-deoxy-L-arabinose transferase-like glycosyltransferase|nr:glycosyltransferase family 39 protein [Pseudomonadota bacterium]MCG6935531.1 glycosyltransferase family 39 protein [Pseudomonadota bacterium]